MVRILRIRYNGGNRFRNLVEPAGEQKRKILRNDWHTERWYGTLGATDTGTLAISFVI